MALSSGRKLGPYEILDSLGSGGMGEVYRARDNRLDRTVAIKVLSSQLSDMAIARERFDREARAISGISHPHICTLYDVGHQDGVDYLVMEYLEGETLAERRRKGTLPIQLTLQYAIEIADAMDKAHRLGIVHRDLKPANVMLTGSGSKLLDFGLAKLHSNGGVLSNRNAGSMTNLTEDGAILGTLQYMAPEQLEGRDTDARTDIFAFGAVVYEMATGRKAFEGSSNASLIGAILHVEPPSMSAFEPLSSHLFDRIIRKCLAKNPADRWQSAHDLADELRWVSGGESQIRDTRTALPRAAKARGFLWPAVSAVLALAVVALGALYHYREVPERYSGIRFQIAAPGSMILSPAPADLNVSPDGRHVVFATLDASGNQLLWLRSIESMTARPLPGTENAFSPFWSPDSRQIAFFAQGRLQRIDVSGGTPETICDAPDGRGGTWNRDGVIVFARNLGGPLYRVAAPRGTPAALAPLDQAEQESGHLWPAFLPDGRHYVYLAWSPRKEKRQIRLGSLDGQAPKTLFAAESNIAFVQPDHLLYVTNGKLVAQRFDADRLELSGEPFPVADDVWANPATGRASFAIGESGVLVYRNGINFSTTQFLQRDRNGTVIVGSGILGGYSNPSLSPDKKRIAADVSDYQKGTRNIWTLELDRGGITSRFTFSPSTDLYPVWSPDGTEIAYLSDRGVPNGWNQIYRARFGGNSKEEALFKSDSIRTLEHWSRRAQAVIFRTFNRQTRNDLWMLPLAAGERDPEPLLQSNFDEIHAQLSPDEQWIAYSSDETGRYEIYVQKFPSTGEKRQVSTEGGMQPMWHPDGKELFYLAPDRKLMVVTTRTSAVFESDTPKALFQSGVYGPSVVRSRNYVVGPRGESFIINTVVDSRQPINVVIGWTPR